MLIKLFTANNSIKIFENIENIEIHEGRYGFPPPHIIGLGVPVPMTEHCVQVPYEPWGPYTKNFINAYPVLYFPDESPLPSNSISNTKPDVKVIDFLIKGNSPSWQRLIVTDVAYVCNDDGKTIQTVRVYD